MNLSGGDTEAIVGCRRVVAALVILLWQAGVFPALAEDGSRAKFFAVETPSDLLEAVSAAAAGGGTTIDLRPGVYEIDRPLRFENLHHVNLRGSGWNTFLRKKGGGNAVEFLSSHFCVVQDLGVSQEAGAADGSGIVFRDASSCTVDHCRIEGFADSAVRYEGRAESPMSSNTLRDSHLISNRGAQLYSRHNNDFYILGNQMGTHGPVPQFGCKLDHSSAGTYSMNYHWGNEVAFHMGSGCKFNRIENNRFEQSRREGIRIGDETAGDANVLHIVTGNTIHTNGEFTLGAHSAVIAYDAIDVTFTSNQVFSWDSESTRHRHALELGRGCRSWIVKDNIFRHQTEAAIVRNDDGGHLVKDNFGVEE